MKDKTKIKKKLDVLFSQVVRARDKECLKCRSCMDLQCAHAASRRHLSGRWDELNAVTLCTRCHLWWAHKEPLEFTLWLKENHPAVYERALEVSTEVWKPTLEDYQALETELKARLKSLLQGC